MLSILTLTDDASLRTALAAGVGAAMDALQRSSRSAQIRWLEDLPPRGGAAQPVDILLLDCRGEERPSGLLARLRPRPALAVLVAAESRLSDIPEDDVTAADDVLIWPISQVCLRAWCGRWLRRLRDLRRIDQLEEKLNELTRNNNTFRRKAAKYLRQVQLRDRHDGDLRRILARMEGITRLSQQINSLKLEQIVQLCVQRVPALIGVRLVSLYLHEDSKRRLRLQQHNHPYPINVLVDLEDRPNSPMALAVGRKQLLLVNEPDWAELADQAITRPYAHRYATGNCVIAPLVSGGRVVGVLNLADRLDGLAFDDLTDLMPIRQLSELLGASIRNIELYQTVQQQAKSDGMTGLANHSTFMRELGREVRRARRYGEPLSLVMVDVDSLKRINDQMGHVAGDRALQMVARQIVRSIRGSDLAARYGGDEFTILLPSTPLASVQAVAERIVRTICQIPVVHQRLSSHVTVSVGIGQYDGGSTADQFIEQVDKAMYRAKGEGKNRIAVCA